MNSLTELNGYVNGLSFEYTDDRYARVIFDRTTATNQTIITNEGQSFTHPLGVDVVDVVNYGVSAPTMTIDISGVYANGVRLNWASTPVGVTIVQSIPGRYVVSGINSKGIWDIIRQPTVTLPTNLPDAFFGTFTYTTTINYTDANLGAQSKSYTTAVSVLDVTYLTTPLEFVYQPNTVSRITNTPQIASYLDATYVGATWTITATVSAGTAIDSFSSASTSGGTFTYNAGTKGFTISGTRAQVNAHLVALDIDSNINEIDFVIYYVLSNNQDGTTDSKSQSMVNKNIQYFSNPSQGSVFYTEDTAGAVTGGPAITDNSYSGSGNYTVEIYPSDTADVYTISSTGTGGTSSFNNSTKKLTIVGTKAQVNSHLSNITLQAESDVDYLFQIFYSLTTPIGATSTKIQQLVCNSNDTEVSNIALSRSYIGNRTNLIFASNTPQITDLDTTGVNNYTITLTCSFGQFGITDVSGSNPYSYTGTKSEVNAILSQVRFWPNKNVSSNGTMTYQQIKNSVTQVTQTIPLTGTSGVYQASRTLVFNSTQTWTPSIEDVLYSNWEGFITGAGGGGGYFGGGGGGAGEVLYVKDQTLTSQTYIVTIGVGGAGATGSSGFISGLDGNSTIFAGITARGGKGGIAGLGPSSGITTPGKGGDSGSGNPGGNGYRSADGLRANGGGGGGQGFAGGNATTNTSGKGGDGDFTWTNRFGQTGTTLTAGGGGGGGGGNLSRGLISGGAGATSTTPATTSSTSSWKGGGGGGGNDQVYLQGAAGQDGQIIITLY